MYESHTSGSLAVHPRLRGELIMGFGSDALGLGSSPLTRGTHVFEIVKQKRIRFIPAYAGNSACERFCSNEYAVHPRLRGELYRSCLSPR